MSDRSDLAGLFQTLSPDAQAAALVYGVVDPHVRTTWQVALILRHADIRSRGRRLTNTPLQDATRELVRVAHQGFERNLTIVGCGPDEVVAGVPLLEEARGLIDGMPAAYVCHGYSCRQPVTRPEQVREEMTSLG